MESFKRKKLDFRRMRKKEVRTIIPPSHDEMLVHAICALDINCFSLLDLKGKIWRWVCANYGPVTPGELISAWTAMRKRSDVDVKVEKKAGQTFFRVLRLGSLQFDPDQLRMF